MKKLEKPPKNKKINEGLTTIEAVRCNDLMEGFQVIKEMLFVLVFVLFSVGRRLS